MAEPGIGVVHLVRAANASGAVQRFLDSYRRHAAGLDHRLILVLKGFTDPGALAGLRRSWADLAVQELAVPDRDFDIGPYFTAARATPLPFLCFLNSFSVIRGAGWLELLHRPFADPSVGAVGATGSWETPAHLRPGEHWGPRRSRAALKLPLSCARAAFYGCFFAAFPNPHLRSNAFLVRREDFLALRRSRIPGKLGTRIFEAGRHSMSRQLARRGKRVLVVGASGRSYPGEAWPASRTFRAGEQDELLIADNRTEQYALADAAERRRLAAIAWGPGPSPTGAAGGTVAS